MNKLSDRPLLWMTIGLCAVLLLPALFMDGMFMDGTQYVCAARNFAFGNGTFWEPTVSATHNLHFHDQPPLLFFLEGSFFRILGDHRYTERIYCLVIAMLNAWLIIRCWKRFGKKEISWLPLLLWFIMPVTFYAFINNLEEITMSVFALAAMDQMLRALHAEKEMYFQWFVAGIWLLMAGMTKGVQGMFLVAVPFFAWIILRNGNFFAMIRRSVLIILPLCFFIVFVCMNDAARESFHSYYLARIVNTFTQFSSNDLSRFHLLKELWLDSIPSLFIISVFIIAAGKKFQLPQDERKRMSLFMLACAIAGILPLLVTLEQRGFYLVTALPYLAFAMSMLVEEQAMKLTQMLQGRKFLSKSIMVLSVCIIIGSLCTAIARYNIPKRDAELIGFLNAAGKQTGKDKLICVSSGLNENWSLITYGQRYFQMSFTNDTTIDSPFFIMENGNEAELPLRFRKGQKPDISTEHFSFFRSGN